MTPLSVSQLNTQIKALLESHFVTLMVEGEISNFTAHTSGHFYFSLKDENSNIRCVMFKGNTAKLKFRPQNGMKIIASCGLSVYTPRGEYQLLCENLEPAGIGSLKVAFEQLKQKLEAKGYFKAELKRSIPKFPQNIALITSATGAALQDMKRVAENRWKMTKFILFNTLVQGEGAKENIVKNIQLADSLDFDCIVLARGGGSIEDLWAFNEETVANAIYTTTTPIVSAIGHEIDYLISDFVADLRAPTPSAAMEMILPDKNELAMMLDDIGSTISSRMQQAIRKAELSFGHANEMLNAKSPKNQVILKIQETKMLHQRLNQTYESKLAMYRSEVDILLQDLKFEQKNMLAKKSNEFVSISNRLEQLNPQNSSNESFPLLVKDGKKTTLNKLTIGDTVELQTAKLRATAKIQSLNKLGK